MKYVTRETGNLLRTPSNHDLTPTAMTNRGTGSGKRDHGAMVAPPTASNGWRLGLRHGRHDQRQATTSERQRLVRQEEAATRHSHSRRRYLEYVRPTNSLGSSVLNSTAMHVNGNTSARSAITPVDTQSAAAHTDGSASARPSGNSDSHSDSLGLTVRQVRWRLLGYFHSGHSAQLLELNFNYTVSQLHDRVTVY